MDIHALKRHGITISEITRRTDHDRKTIRADLVGQRTRKPIGHRAATRGYCGIFTSR